MTILHSLIQSAECHEPKHISTALTTDSGKVITPSAAVDGASVFRKLAAADLSDAATVVTLAGVQSLTNKRIQPRVYALGNMNGGVVLPSGGTWDYAYGTLIGNSTMVMVTSTGAMAERIIIRVTQGGSGSYTIVWPAKFRWPGGTPPTLSTTAGKTDVFVFVYDSVTDNYDCISQNLGMA